MNLYFFDDNRIITFSLPFKKIGDFWMTDENDKNLVNIKAENNEWMLSASDSCKIVNTIEENQVLKSNTFYTIERNEKNYLLFVDELEDNTFNSYQVVDGRPIRVGSNTSCEISINSNYIMDTQIQLVHQDNKWNLAKAQNAKVYVNNENVESDSIIINNGDVININEVKIIVCSKILFVNNTLNNVTISNMLPETKLVVDDEVVNEEIANEDMYKDEDYFMRSPRMKKNIEEYNMQIDSPPQKEPDQEIPLIFTLGPMLTMAASSCVTLTTALQKIISKEATFKSSIPTLVITIAMLASMLVWPFLTKKYEAKRKKDKEQERQIKYSAYLNSKKEELAKEFADQTKTLQDSLLPNEVCYDIIINKRRSLWERKIEDNDFLNLRMGVGNIPFNAKISYQSEDFKMEDDDLKRMLEGLVKSYETMTNVPIGYSFSKNNKTAINGIFPNYLNFTKNLFLQMMSYYSYDELKIVVLTNKKNASKWNFIKKSPYCFSDDKYIRFFADCSEDMQEISEYLEVEFENRKILKNNIEDGASSFSKFKSYYLILIDNIDTARKIDIVNNVLESKDNLGFSLMILEEKLSKLPSEVSNIITIGESQSVILNNESSHQIRFMPEINNNLDMNQCISIINSLPIYNNDKRTELPNTITFLEMFGIGQTEQLNSLNRWKENDPTKTLKTEVGVNENNDLFMLDLHEKQHGPHGLVAGMTGSGKSEFIVTYILSMAVNYSPEEVNFVLIDYKGGGLAGAFQSSELNAKLPHVVGTITNLDKAEINRALSSINSELRRRQEMFNKVKDETGESTIDIYKYQKLYREGVIKEPIAHLIIVCDEFAELKDQQPDFMDDLISTARIGRSLGVHLILATQKPSGVVDAQIWSNAKFKVCLKVQDKQDSMEMIKNDLAAELKNVGRFYLQVGYNEYFALGQSAWAGATYFPNKEFKKSVDKNVYFIDETGKVTKSINNSAKKSSNSSGDELSSILKYLIGLGKSNELKISQLWMDKIPDKIYINDLKTKYGFKKEVFNVNPVIGEYDDPFTQSQGLLTLSLNCDGNTLIYGNQDSGKDEFLQSLVYSIITTYDTSEASLYLMDFGAETLLNFQDVPQVGNIILNGEDEKIENLIKMLNSDMNKRKKLFMSYNGNYNDYIKLSHQTLTNIIVIINSIEVLTEVYPDVVDELVPLIREGSKYGINFVISTQNQTTIKYKIAQCCKQQICLQMNSDTDYRDIFGKTNGILPFNCLGRGLIKLDRVCEFQTAFITTEEEKYNTILNTIKFLKDNKVQKAKEIPVMPETIELKRFDGKYSNLSSIPIGLSKNNLTSEFMNYSKNVINIISSSEIDNVRGFILNELKLIESCSSFNKIVIDASNFFDEYNYNIPLYNDKFNECIDMLNQMDDQLQKYLSDNNGNVKKLKPLKNTIVFVFGIEKLLSKLNDDHKTILKDILKNNKELLKLNFVFVDIPSSFKKYEFEDWYKDNVNATEGLWIGSGITQQYTLKPIIQPQEISNIDNTYGVLLKNGMPTVVKLVNEIK